MAKKRSRPKFILGTIAGTVIIYVGITLIKPINFATRYHSNDRGPTIHRLEEIIREKKVPKKHLDGVVFLKLHEDYFRHKSACIDLPQRIISIPDNNRNIPNFYLYPSFAEDICDEIGHNAYQVISAQLKDKWKDYILRLLDADLRHWQYISQLEKLRSSAFKSKNTNEVKSLDRQISTLYRYSMLPAGFDSDYNIVIDVGNTKAAFNPEELFAQTYAAYLTGIHGEDPNEKKETRIRLGMEKPELEDLHYEGMQLMAEIASQERDGTLPSCTLLDSRSNFIRIWWRYLNPKPYIKAWKPMLSDISFGRRIEDLCHTYTKSPIYIEKSS